jgi:hypothetical protein
MCARRQVRCCPPCRPGPNKSSRFVSRILCLGVQYQISNIKRQRHLEKCAFFIESASQLSRDGEKWDKRRGAVLVRVEISDYRQGPMGDQARSGHNTRLIRRAYRQLVDYRDVLVWG